MIPALSDVAVNTILDDAVRLAGDTDDDIYSQVGGCGHLDSTYQKELERDGGSDAPFGYR